MSPQVFADKSEFWRPRRIEVDFWFPQKTTGLGLPQGLLIEFIRPAAFPPKSPAGLMSSTTMMPASGNYAKSTMVMMLNR